MARSRKRKSNRRAETTPGWLWMAAGFALGLVVAAGVYLAQRTGSELASRRDVAPTPARATEPEPATPVAGSPVAGRGHAATEDGRPDDEPRFEFYELLPEFEVVVPEVESRADPGPPPAKVEEPGRYVLQVGSFSRLADADKLKANLALLGIESRVQRVAIDDQVFHRVRIGPSSDLDEINRIRNQLHERRIDSLLMRAPED